MVPTLRRRQGEAPGYPAGTALVPPLGSPRARRPEGIAGRESTGQRFDGAAIFHRAHFSSFQDRALSSRVVQASPVATLLAPSGNCPHPEFMPPTPLCALGLPMPGPGGSPERRPPISKSQIATPHTAPQSRCSREENWPSQHCEVVPCFCHCSSRPQHGAQPKPI